MIDQSMFYGPSKRCATASFTSALLVCLLACTHGANSMQDDLTRYNSLRLSDSARLYSVDNGEAAAFAGYSFVCRQQADHVPAESDEARAAFARFVADMRAHPEPTAEDRKRRLEYLQQAIALGSWRARYFNANWVLWLDPNTDEARQQFDELWAMAGDGNPAAHHSVLRWTNGMYEDLPQRMRILRAAIERGNPQALSTLGHSFGTRTENLRAMGVKMLECAAAQGDADAYEGLGTIAWLEGRWVDAYRTWQTGANQGCGDCLDHLEDIGLTRPDYTPERGTRGSDSRISALRQHYESQLLFTISELSELREPAPQSMWVHWSDEQLVAVIKARIQLYGVP